MTEPTEPKIDVSIPASLVAQVLADMEEWGRRAPISFRRMTSYLRGGQDQAPALDPPADDKAGSERQVPS